MERILRLRLAAVPKSLPKARHAVLAALDEAAISDAVSRGSVALALTEAVANAVRHAYTDPASSEVDLTVVTDDDGVTITVSDWGMGIDRARDGRRGLGLGLKVIHELTTSATIDSSPAGTTVTMRFATP